MDTSVSVELFVEILNRYVYYFDQQNETVSWHQSDGHGLLLKVLMECLSGYNKISERAYRAHPFKPFHQPRRQSCDVRKPKATFLPDVGVHQRQRLRGRGDRSEAIITEAVVYLGFVHKTKHARNPLAMSWQPLQHHFSRATCHRKCCLFVGSMPCPAISSALCNNRTALCRVPLVTNESNRGYKVCSYPHRSAVLVMA